MTVFFLVSSRASTATVSRVHKAFPANVLCNAIAPELCSKSASRCCLHGWLAASTTVITQHICKAQRLNGMPSPSNTQKHMDTTDLFPAKWSTNTCWLFSKIKDTSCSLTLSFLCLSYEILTFQQYHFFTGRYRKRKFWAIIAIHWNIAPNICMAH